MLPLRGSELPAAIRLLPTIIPQHCSLMIRCGLICRVTADVFELFFQVKAEVFLDLNRPG